MIKIKIILCSIVSLCIAIGGFYWYFNIPNMTRLEYLINSKSDNDIILIVKKGVERKRYEQVVMRAVDYLLSENDNISNVMAVDSFLLSNDINEDVRLLIAKKFAEHGIDIPSSISIITDLKYSAEVRTVTEDILVKNHPMLKEEINKLGSYSKILDRERKKMDVEHENLLKEEKELSEIKKYLSESKKIYFFLVNDRGNSKYETRIYHGGSNLNIYKDRVDSIVIAPKLIKEVKPHKRPNFAMLVYSYVKEIGHENINDKYGNIYDVPVYEEDVKANEGETRIEELEKSIQKKKEELLKSERMWDRFVGKRGKVIMLVNSQINS